MLDKNCDKINNIYFFIESLVYILNNLCYVILWLIYEVSVIIFFLLTRSLKFGNVN